MKLNSGEFIIYMKEIKESITDETKLFPVSKPESAESAGNIIVKSENISIELSENAARNSLPRLSGY